MPIVFISSKGKARLVIILILFSLSLPVFLFAAAPAAYGNAWAGVESGLQLLAYTAATATPDQSLVGSLHGSLRQRWSLHPLSRARGPIYILTGAVLGS